MFTRCGSEKTAALDDDLILNASSGTQRGAVAAAGAAAKHNAATATSADTVRAMVRVLVLVGVLFMGVWAPAAGAAETLVIRGFPAGLSAADGRFYVAGVDYIGVPSGPFVVADARTRAVIHRFPALEGATSAACADGAGGWYVALAASLQPSAKPGRVLHVLPDGAIDPSFGVDRPAPVTLLAMVGQHLVVGREPVRPGLRNSPGPAELTRVDPATGRPDPVAAMTIDIPAGFEPGIKTSAAMGDRLVIGGRFTQAAGIPRRNLLALEVDDWTLDAGFAPDPDDEVRSVATDGARVFVAGAFTNISGGRAPGIAALKVSDGSLDAGFQSPFLDRPVSGVGVDAGRLYLTGDFRDVGGRQRINAAALDATTGALDRRFRPVLRFGLEDPPLVYGGQVLMDSLDGLVGFDASTGARRAPALPADGEVTVLAREGSHVLVGGKDTRSFGGEAVNGLAAIDPRSGTVDPRFKPRFGPPFDGSARAVALQDGRVFASGRFTTVDGVARPGLAALNPTTGRLVRGFAPTGPTLDGSALQAHRGRVYATSADGRRLAALDARTGAAVRGFRAPTIHPFNPPDHHLDIAAGRLVLAGAFDSIDGHHVPGPATLDARSGRLDLGATPTAPFRTGYVHALAHRAGTVYVGGEDLRRDGRHTGLVAYSARTGRIRVAFRPRLKTDVVDVLATAHRLFTITSGSRLVSLRRRDGRRCSFSVPTEWYPQGLWRVGSRLVVAGHGELHILDLPDDEHNRCR